MTLSKGAVELRRLLGERGAKSRLAEKLGINAPVVSNWLNGSRVPEAANRARLEDELGIDWRSWDQPAESEPSNGGAAA